MSGRHLAFPFHVTREGRTAAPSDLETHVKQELIQLLLTNPGERPFQPEFGGGLRRFVFENNSDIVAGVAKATITDAISHWLGDRIELLVLEVENEESTLRVDLQYRVIASGEQGAVRFEHGT